MRNLYNDTRVLDAAVKAKFQLTDDILMENAAAALEKAVNEALESCAAREKRAEAATQSGRATRSERADQAASAPSPLVLVVCGAGDNGGDGWALARRLYTSQDMQNPCAARAAVAVYEAVPPKSESCARQKQRAVACGVPVTQSLCDCAVLVDCLFGSGFRGGVSSSFAALIDAMNGARAFKIACDVPSGLASLESSLPEIERRAFCADKTVAMGALKTAFFADSAKDFCGGTIECASLGIAPALYEAAAAPNAFLLEERDMRLPFRAKRNVHKGNFGHAVVACCEKTGAAVLASSACFALGAGLVSLVTQQNPPCALPPEIMYDNALPKAISAFAAGMGLGHGGILEEWAQILNAHPQVPCVLDADFFHYEWLAALLKGRSESGAATVLTPHPKEFASLLSLCGIGSFSVAQIQSRRLEIAAEFCRRFEGVVLLLKGANSVIGVCPKGGDPRLMVNSFGMPCLAKAGSGDVLSGFVCALLAQGYSAEDAAVSASLAHALASRKVKSDFGMTPRELIECAKAL